MHIRAAFKVDNPRVMPLVDGTVFLEDVTWEWALGHPGELFLQQMRENVFDVFEFSLAESLILRTLPQFQHLDWVALPVFPNKAFLQMGLYVNRDAGIADFGDLAHKRVGVPDFQMTAAIWFRIMLRVLHHISPDEIQWINGRPPSKRHGAEMGVDQRFLASIPITNLREDESLEQLLHAGSVDAAFGDQLTVPLHEGETVAKLFTPQRSRQVMKAFYDQAGCLPVNHGVFVKRRILQEHPDLGPRLFQAFELAKQESYRRAEQAAAAFLLFRRDDWNRQTQEFGPDPFPYGLEPNLKMLNLLADELMAEGLIPTRPAFDAFFLPV